MRLSKEADLEGVCASFWRGSPNVAFSCALENIVRNVQGADCRERRQQRSRLSQALVNN